MSSSSFSDLSPSRGDERSAGIAFQPTPRYDGSRKCSVFRIWSGKPFDPLVRGCVWYAYPFSALIIPRSDFASPIVYVDPYPGASFFANCVPGGAMNQYTGLGKTNPQWPP